MSMSTLLRLLAILVVTAAAACATVPHPEGLQTRPYATGDLTLLVHYTAKESCSCLYVQEMPEDFCHAYTKANPAVASWRADAKARSVTASALAFWSAKAHFVDAQTGCVLDD
ncbi:MAG TPA: hypothetical protein VGO62_19755 [Myxococcota bacterium]|jgi:hypothetical protein